MKSFQTRFKSFIQKLVDVPKHFLFSTKTNPLLILDRFYYNQHNNNLCVHQLFILNPKTKHVKQIHIPRVTNSDMGYKIISSCNGLICIAHYSFDQFSTLFLWNPSTNQTKRIIEQQQQHHQQQPLILPPNCLIGFYKSNDDFHIVRFHSFEHTKSDDSLSKKIYAIRGEEYSLCKGSWREIKGCDQNLILKGNLFWTENTVTVEKILFWVAMEVTEEASHEMILYFNSTNDVLSKIEMPFLSKECVEVYKKLVVYNYKNRSCVGLIICAENKHMEQSLNLWILCDEYEGIECCWIKVQTIGMFSRLERPIGVWKNEILMATNKVIHSVGGVVGLLPQCDIGAEFCYNVFNHEKSFFALHDMEEIDYVESGGFLLI